MCVDIFKFPFECGPLTITAFSDRFISLSQRKYRVMLRSSPKDPVSNRNGVCVYVFVCVCVIGDVHSVPLSSDDHQKASESLVKNRHFSGTNDLRLKKERIFAISRDNKTTTRVLLTCLFHSKALPGGML